MNEVIQKWVGSVKAMRPRSFECVDVLEFGAMNINGSVRHHFEDCTILGVDCQPGPNVDVVCLAHEFHLNGRQWDTVFSCEQLEHDPHWRESLETMWRAVKPMGLWFMSCACPPRMEHGTTRSGCRDMYGPDHNHYRNITLSDLAQAIDESNSRFHLLRIDRDENNGNLCAIGIKK